MVLVSRCKVYGVNVSYYRYSSFYSNVVVNPTKLYGFRE